MASSGTVFDIHLVILNCVDFGFIEVSEWFFAIAAHLVAVRLLFSGPFTSFRTFATDKEVYIRLSPSWDNFPWCICSILHRVAGLL